MKDTPKGADKTYETNTISSNQGELVAVKEAFPIYYNLNQGTTLSAEPTNLNNTFSKLDTLIAPELSTVNLSTGGSFIKQQLFDTGSIVYICTDKALFAKLRIGKLVIVRTKGSPVQLQGISMVKLKPYTSTIGGRP